MVTRLCCKFLKCCHEVTALSEDLKNCFSVWNVTAIPSFSSIPASSEGIWQILPLQTHCLMFALLLSMFSVKLL